MNNMPKCDRCYNETRVTKMSWLNQQTICMECAEAEKEHPRYQEARKAEREAMLAGNLNFQANYL